MKKIFLITIIFLSTCFVQAQDSKVFYYHNNKKIFLDVIENSIIINFKNDVNEFQKDKILKKLVESNFTISELSKLSYCLSKDLVQFDFDDFFSKENIDKSYFYFSNMLIYKDSTILWTNNKITVNFNQTSDLFEVLIKNDIPFINVDQIGSNQQTFVIELEIDKINAIEYANILEKSGYVNWAQPYFMKIIQNPKIYNQNLKRNNFEYNDYINLEEAWYISNGSGVRVAVIDDGVFLRHPDLENNFIDGFDATDHKCGGDTHGGTFSCPACPFKDDHGTMVSGLICAEGNNNHYFKGVAFEGKVIPIRIFYSDFNNYLYMCVLNCEPKWVVNGIKYAWEKDNVDVINNSWTGPPETLIEQELGYALKKGRDGKGCIVIFSSGNNGYNYVEHYGSLPNVISVGGIDLYNKRVDNNVWGSQYGDSLNIVAPGDNVFTTDMSFNGYSIVSGTSFSASFVSGLAALILSLNPNLTGQEVKNIIESTAQKINKYHPTENPNGYVYIDDPNHYPNGLWNEEVGYGLIDCFAALEATCVENFSNQVVIGPIVEFERTVIGCNDLLVENVIVPQHNKLTLNAPGKITINGPFKVASGAQLKVK